MKLSRVAIATVALTSGHAFAQSQFPQSLRTNLGFAQSSYATGPVSYTHLTLPTKRIV